jgi:hypothetical protein
MIKGWSASPQDGTDPKKIMQEAANAGHLAAHQSACMAAQARQQVAKALDYLLFLHGQPQRTKYIFYSWGGFLVYREILGAQLFPTFLRPNTWAQKS